MFEQKTKEASKEEKTIKKGHKTHKFKSIEKPSSSPPKGNDD